MKYKKRIADKLLANKLDAFGAALIVGPKGCGKTTTAKQKAKSIIEFQDEEKRDNYLMIADTMPSKLLEGKTPILFDEWQDAPKLWGKIRKSIDDLQKTGLYILTGSSSSKIVTPHTGTLRISRMKMYPMSLYETNESNGEVSLINLFNNPSSFKGCKSNMSLDNIIFSICRGGWPLALRNKKESSQLAVAKDLFEQTYNVDISNIDKKKRNSKQAKAILHSYARNICTLAETNTIYKDVIANNKMSMTSFYDYIDALERLYIIDDIEAWCPSIRSKSALRSSLKRNFIDPSIAVAALGLTPSYFSSDFKTLGSLFESLCIRDLKIYSSINGGSVSYYRDRYGLEADCVLHLNDGRYALIEFKLGEKNIEEGAKHLLKIEELIKEYNQKETQCPLRLPDLKMVITTTEYGYKRNDDVLVIPIGCLKD